MLIGRHDPDRMMSWIGQIWEKFPGNWHDAVDVATYGDPDGAPGEIADRLPVSIDFYGNDIFNMGDNCIESDGGAHNIRVFRNRCFNVGSQALSAQPMYGGPVYFYQNLVYNAPTIGSLKFVATPAGVLVYQNTFVGEVVARGPASNVHFRNNLIVAQDDAFEWNTPPPGVIADYQAAPIVHRFRTLREYSDAARQDAHSVLVDYDVFVNVTMPDKSDPQRLYKPDGLDFRLKPGSAAVDAGIALPSINDDYTGKAPDIGAYEVGRPVPHYGPR